MADFFSSLSLIGDSIFQFLTRIFNLYTGSVVLVCVLGLWVLRKIVRLIRAIT